MHQSKVSLLPAPEGVLDDTFLVHIPPVATRPQLATVIVPGRFPTSPLPKTLFLVSPMDSFHQHLGKNQGVI